jgi:hypothetical protein
MATISSVELMLTPMRAPLKPNLGRLSSCGTLIFLLNSSSLTIQTRIPSLTFGIYVTLLIP